MIDSNEFLKRIFLIPHSINIKNIEMHASEKPTLSRSILSLYSLTRLRIVFIYDIAYLIGCLLY